MKKFFVAIVFGSLVFQSCGGNVQVEKKTETGESVKTEVKSEQKDVVVDEPEESLPSAKDVEFVVSADSVLVDDTDIGFNYGPDMVADNDFSTAWCVESGKRVGEISFEFEETVRADKFGIVPGFARDEKIYNQNNGLKTLKVIFDNKDEQIFKLQDAYGMQFIKLENQQFKKISFVISDVYQGNKYDDSCISEIDFKSDYVVNEDAVAALAYYKKYKADFALKPYDIVGEILISDTAKDNCGRPGIPSDALHEYEGNIVLYAAKVFISAKINEYGREGDELSLKWYVTDGSSDPLKTDREWRFKEVRKVVIEKSCDGKLFVHTVLDTDGVSGTTLGVNKIQFYNDGKMVGSEIFMISQ